MLSSVSFLTSQVSDKKFEKVDSSTANDAEERIHKKIIFVKS